MRGNMNDFEILQRLSFESRLGSFSTQQNNPVIANKFVHFGDFFAGMRQIIERRAEVVGQSTHEPLLKCRRFIEFTRNATLILIGHVAYSKKSASGGLRFFRIPENAQHRRRRYITNCSRLQQERASRFAESVEG